MKIEKSNNYIVKFFQKFFSAKNDKAWKDWVDYKNRDHGDLIQLLLSDVHNEFKKRAIVILCAPNKDLHSLYWYDNGGYLPIIRDKDFEEVLKALPLELLRFIKNLISMFCEKISLAHNPNESEGVSIFVSTPGKYHDTLYAYNSLNNLIVTMLSLLPQKDGEELFKFFSINDTYSFVNVDNISGYNPLKYLLRNKNVPLFFKQEADQRMKKIVLNELQGVKPREEWEYAPKHYIKILESTAIHLSTVKNLSNEHRAFFKDQCNFALEKIPTMMPIIPSSDLQKFFEVFSLDTESEFCFAVISKTYNHPNFSISHLNDYNAFNQARKIISQYDKELYQRMLSHEKKFKESVILKKIKSKEELQKERKILSKMK